MPLTSFVLSLLLGAVPDARAGTITTIVGTGSKSYCGDGGPALSACIKWPAFQSVDSLGNIYLADQGNNRIRRIASEAGGFTSILTVAGIGSAAYSGDGGPASLAQLNGPSEVLVDGSGNLLIADTSNHAIRMVMASGTTFTTIMTVAGGNGAGATGDGGPAISARFNNPNAVEADATGNMYIVDFNNNRIRRVEASGTTYTTIMTVVGTGVAGSGGDSGPAMSAQLNGPSSVAVDSTGNLYVTEYSGNRVRRVQASGTTFTTITTVAGTGVPGSGGDGGPAVSAQLNGPGAIIFDKSGNICFIDESNHRVRRVDAHTGVIGTVAGTGVPGFAGDGGSAILAQLWSPRGLSCGANGDLYISDSNNARIRKVSFDTCDLEWTARASMPSARYMLAAAEAGGRICAIGGWGGSFRNTNEEYNPVTNVWTTRAPRPTTGQGMAVVGLNGLVYAMGGATPGGARDTIERYNPGTDTWVGMAPMLMKRSNLAAAVLDGVIYAIGGGDPDPATVEAYEPSTNTWTTRAPLPTARSSLAAVVVNGVIYAIGGTNGVTSFATVEAYDPVTNAWTPRAPMPTARYGVCAVVVNGVVYAIGGSNGVTTFATAEAYDPMTNTWTTKAPMLTQRYWPGASAVDGVVYAIGGDFGGVLSSVEAGRFVGGVLKTAASATSNVLLKGQWFTVTLSVMNMGQAAIKDLSPAIAPIAGGGLVALQSGPSPPGPMTLNPGGSVNFVWTYSASGAGQVTFTVTAMGLVCISSTAVVGSRVSVLIHDPAQQPTLRYRNPEPLYVNAGEQQLWRLSFSNGVADTFFNITVTTLPNSFDQRTYAGSSFSVTLTGGGTVTPSWATAPTGPWTNGEPPNGTGVPLYLRWAVSRLSLGNTGELSYRTLTTGPVVETLLESYASATMSWDAGLQSNAALSYSTTATGKRIAAPLSWIKVYDDPAGNDDIGRAVAIDGSGSILAAGYEDRSDIGQGANWLVRKYDGSGSPIWNRSYNSPANSGDVAYGVAVDAGGNVYAGGSEDRPDLGQAGNWLVRKYDSAGSFVWDKSYNTSDSRGEYVNALAVDAAGDVIAVGIEQWWMASGYENWRLTAYGGGGAQLWTQSFNGPGAPTGCGWDEAKDVVVDQAGNVIVAGRSTLGCGSGGVGVVRKYSGTGSFIWGVSFGPGNPVCWANGIDTDGAGNVIVVGGDSRGDIGQGDNWLIRRYDSDGNLQWARSYNGPASGDDVATDAAVRSSGNVLVVGYETVPGQGKNWLVREYDSAGNLVGSWSHDGIVSGDDHLYGLKVVPGTDDFAVVGDETVRGEQEAFAVARYSAAVFSPPAVPMSLVAFPQVSGIQLGWTAAVEGTRPVSGYFLYRSTTAGFMPTFSTKIADVFGASATWYVDATAQGGVQYYYRIRAVDTLGAESANSNEATARYVEPCDLDWVTKAAMPTPRIFPAVATVGATIYVIGGLNGVNVSTVEAYDPATDTWVTRAPMPTVRRSLAAVEVGGIIYAMGGYSPYLTTVEAYDPATNTWVARAPMSTAREGLAAAVVGGTVYAIGGNDAGSEFAVVEAYDPATNTWVAKADMPTPRGELATAVVNGVIYAIGGADRPATTTYSTVEAYDPVTNTWVTRSPMPTARGEPGVTVLGGRIYVAGGRVDMAGNAGITTVEVYDPATDTWSTMADMTTGRDGLGAATVNGRIYAVGGGSMGVNVPPIEQGTFQGGVIEIAATVTPAVVTRGQWFVVALNVWNTGSSWIRNATPEMAVGPGAGLVHLEVAPPAGPVDLNIHDSATYWWTYSASGAGVVTFTLSETGLVCPSSTAVVSSRVAVTIVEPAKLEASLGAGPARVCPGRSLLVTLTVTNTGATTAYNVSMGSLGLAGSGAASWVAGPSPSPPFTLTPGRSAVFTWTYTGAGIGGLVFTSTVTGTDELTGYLVRAGPVVSGTVVVATAGTLAAGARLSATGISTAQWFTVTLTVTNTGGIDAEAVTPGMLVGPGSGLVVLEAGPAPPGPVTITAGACQSFVWTYSAAGSGLVKFSATAAGTTCGGLANVLGSATATATIQSGVTLRSSLAALPPSVCVGQSFLVTLTVTNTGGATATGLNAGPLLIGGTGGAAYVAGPWPAMPTVLGGGGSITFTWTYGGTAPGAVVFTTTVTATDANSGVSTTTGPVTSLSALTGQGAVRPAVSVGQSFLVTLTVTNTGGVSAAGIMPSVAVGPGAGLVTLAAGPWPAGPVALLPGQAQLFTWTYTGAAAGLVAFTVTAAGTALCGGFPVDVPAWDTVTTVVQTPAALGAAVAMTPTLFCSGQNVVVMLTVTNTGQAGATGVTVPAVPFQVGGTGTMVKLAGPYPAMPAAMAGGASVTFTWTYAGAAFGSVTVTTTVTGADSNSGAGVATGPATSGPATVTSGGVLAAAGSMATVVSVGQVLTIAFTVTNTGGAEVVNVLPALAAGPGGSLITGTAGASPAGPVTIPVGGSQTFAWTRTTVGSGTVVFTITAAGTACGGVPVLGTAQVSSMVLSPAQLKASVARLPGSVCTGQNVLVTFTVTNMGQASAVGVTATVFGVPAAGVGVVAGPTPPGPVALAGGQRVTFTWTFAGGVPGAVVFAGTATGTDVNSGLLVVSNAAMSATLGVTDPGTLAAAVAAPVRVSTGQSFAATLTATNTGGGAVTGVAPAIVAGGPGIATLVGGPVPPGPVTLAAGQGQTFAWTFSAAGSGLVVFTATASGQTCGAVPVTAAGAGSATVEAAAGLAAKLDVLAPSVCVGQGFMVTLTVTNPGEATAAGVLATALVTGGSGVGWVAGPYPGFPVGLAGGTARTFTWTYTGLAPGTAVFTTTLTATDANAGWTIRRGPVSSVPLAVAVSGTLAASGSARPTVSAGQWFTVTLTVTNTGGLAVDGVVPEAAVGPGAGLVALKAGPVPPGPVSVAAGTAQTFTWTYSAAGSGSAVFTMTASGVSACGGGPVPVSRSATVATAVQTPATLQAWVTAVPGIVCVGQGVLVSLTVSNSGGATASGLAVPATPFRVAGTGGATVSAGPSPPLPASLVGGAGVTLTWTCTGASAGPVWLTTTMTGADANSGQGLTTGPATSGAVTVETAAVLAAAAASPASVMVGDWVTVTLTVTNTGGQAAVGVNPTMAISPGAGLVVLKAGPAPAGPVTVIPGAAQTFGWTYSVAGRGSIGFAPAAAGLTCTAVGVTGTATVFMQAQAPAQLAVDLLELSPTAVNLGAPVTARLALRNAGDATLRVTGISPVIGIGTTGGLGAPGPSAPSLPFLLTGGASQAVTWQHGTGAPCGTVYITAMAAGVEIATGRSLAVGPVASNVVGLAGAPAAIAFTPAVPQAVGGERVLLTAYVTDTCGIGVPGQAVEFGISAGGGSLSAAMGMTDVTGRVPVELTLGLDPGTNAVRAQVAWTSLSATALVQSLANPLALDSPGGALSSNVFSPATGEIVLARISPRNNDPILVYVYTPSGRLVRKLNSQHFRSIGGGQILVEWDGRSDDEFLVTRGVYLIRITGGGLSPVVLKVVVR